MRKAAAKKAASDYRPYYETGARDKVDRILFQGTGADTHFGKGGIYEDAGSWYAPVPAAAIGGSAAAPSSMVRMLKGGKTFEVPAANVEAAKQRGYTEVK
jgi:hypothetical protein